MVSANARDELSGKSDLRPSVGKTDDFEIQRQLIFVGSAERIGINRSSAAREQRLLVSDAALPREGCKHIRQAVRQERRSAIHDMEVEMRGVGIAGIAEQPEYLACCR